MKERCDSEGEVKGTEEGKSEEQGEDRGQPQRQLMEKRSHLTDGSKVSDNVDDTEDQARLGPHGKVGASSVARDGVTLGGGDELVVHGARRANHRGGRVHNEHKRENDGKQEGRV